jgi:hypothetical protein
MEYLDQHEVSSFYYVSHAPFLFMADGVGIIDQIYEEFVLLGIPKGRLQRPIQPIG